MVRKAKVRSISAIKKKQQDAHHYTKMETRTLQMLTEAAHKEVLEIPSLAKLVKAYKKELKRRK